MDKLVGIPICLVEHLITNAPIAGILIAVGLFIYYKLSRLLLKKILGKKEVEQMSDMRATNSAELYDSTARFAGHAAEFLIILIFLSMACSSYGLIDFKEIMDICIFSKYK